LDKQEFKVVKGTQVLEFRELQELELLEFKATQEYKETLVLECREPLELLELLDRQDQGELLEFKGFRELQDNKAILVCREVKEILVQEFRE
jgi:hypothetical protein